MSLPDPEELLVQHETNRYGLRRIMSGILRHLILISRLLEVLLFRYNELDRDIEFFALSLGLARVSQAHDANWRLSERQTTQDQDAPDDRGSTPSPETDEG